MKYEKKGFPRLMRTYRAEHCLTQKECAKAIGVTDATYSGWETGRHYPAPELAVKIAQFLGFDLIILEPDRDPNEPKEKERDAMSECPYKERCCMKWHGKCRALQNTRFRDGVCHFRKEYAHGPNLYDIKDKPHRMPVVPVYCSFCKHGGDSVYGVVCRLTGRTMHDDDYCSLGVERRFKR